MGKVNIFFSPIANKIFLNFKETNKLKNKYKKKYYFVGWPNYHLSNYRLRKINIKENIIKKIFVCGGSQGAINLNYKIKNLLLKLNEETSIKSIKLIKELNEWLEYELPENLLGKVLVTKFNQKLTG